jgi:predicted aspartyl protease
LRVAFSKSKCYPHREAYELPLVLVNLITGTRAEVEAAIDTGFDGAVMVDSGTYSRLALDLSERPEGQFPVYRTLSGTTVFRSSSARAVVAGKEIAVDVITPVHGRGKNLIGRGVLREFTTLLHAAETYCVGEARLES